MADEAFASINGARLTRLTVTVANAGAWVADADFEAAPEPQRSAVIRIGDTLELHGTFQDRQQGVFAMQRHARIVGGAGGWSEIIPPKQYHSDAGVRAQLIAEDAASAVGEKLGTFLPASERVGPDYVRAEGPASQALADAAGSGVAWWVDYEGVTHVGPRPARALPPGSYTLLAHDPRDQIVTLAMDDPSLMAVGAIVADERIGEPLTVRTYTLTVTADELRVHAYGGMERGLGRLAGLVAALIKWPTSGRLFGCYRYRVVRMAGARVELQAVRKAAGLPDLLPLSLWPGVPGAAPELTPGAEVLVSFVEGDRTQPIVTGFVGSDGPGFVPVRLTLGGDAGAPAARQGDVVEVQLPPASFSGTIGGTSATGLLTFTPAKALGQITSGSSRVRVAT